MIVSLLAFASATISVENPGIRLELFLKEVSKQTGVGFHCPTFLKDEVLAASFKDQSIDIVKSQLARVIHGTWEQKPDGWWLTQTSEQKKEEEKWVWDTRNTVLKSQLDAFKAAAPMNEWTIKEAEKYWTDLQAFKKKTGEGVLSLASRIALRMRSPEARLGSTIASKLNLKMLTENPLSVNTNRYTVGGLPGHIELPINLDGALSKYENERQLFQALAGDTELKGKPAHFELSYPSGERGYLYFQWLDKDWRYIGGWFPVFVLIDRNFEPKGENFKVSDSTRDILALQKEINLGREAAPVFEKYRDSKLLMEASETMFHAIQTDPLGIIQGRCWIDFARSVNKPLLVSLKDDEQNLRPALNVPSIAQDHFVIGMKREDADGWVLGRPISPMFNRAWRLDRTLIEEYARLTKTPNTPNFYPILQKCRIIATMNSFTTGIPNQEFLLDDQRLGGYLSGALGTLPEEQVSACLRGERIPVSSLPKLGLDIMNLMVSEGNLAVLSPYAKDESTPLSHVYYLPNGTTGMSLGASIKVEPEFHFEAEPVQDYGTILDISTFAYLLKEAKADSSLFDAKFSLGSRKSFVATIYLGNKSKSEDTSVSVDEKDMPTYTWKTLPDSIRQQVLVAMKKPVK